MIGWGRATQTLCFLLPLVYNDTLWLVICSLCMVTFSVLLHDQQVMISYAIRMILCVAYLPCKSPLDGPRATYMEGKLKYVALYVYALVMQWFVDNYFKSHSMKYKKPLGISY